MLLARKSDLHIFFSIINSYCMTVIGTYVFSLLFSIETADFEFKYGVFYAFRFKSFEILQIRA